VKNMHNLAGISLSLCARVYVGLCESVLTCVP
jgi:hypothetical protein